MFDVRLYNLWYHSLVVPFSQNTRPNFHGKLIATPPSTPLRCLFFTLDMPDPFVFLNSASKQDTIYFDLLFFCVSLFPVLCPTSLPLEFFSPPKPKLKTTLHVEFSPSNMLQCQHCFFPQLPQYIHIQSYAF